MFDLMTQLLSEHTGIYWKTYIFFYFLNRCVMFDLMTFKITVSLCL